MKFGTRTTQKRAGRIVFAWLPVHLIDGRWAWLEYAYRYYDQSYMVRYAEVVE